MRNQGTPLVLVVALVFFSLLVDTAIAAEPTWDEVQDVAFRDADGRPFPVGSTLFVNVKAPRSVAESVWMRVFRGRRAELEAGQGARDTHDGCWLYDSVVLRLTHQDGRLWVAGAHVTREWLRTEMAHTVEEQFFFLRLEPRDRLKDGPLKLKIGEIARYFAKGLEIRITPPAGLTAQDARDIATAIRANHDARSRGVEADHAPCATVMTSEIGSAIVALADGCGASAPNYF